MDLALLLILWCGWCVLHSALITPSFTARAKKRMGEGYKYYRILYNLLAVATIIPVYFYTLALQGEMLWRWPEILEVVRYGLLLCSLLLFYAGARNYDMPHFLGLHPIISGESHLSLSDSSSFQSSGILQVTRHPWYLGALLLIWTVRPDFYASTLVMKMVLTGYLLIGTHLEERKLISAYGEKYVHYSREVSMLFPWKWLTSLVRSNSR